MEGDDDDYIWTAEDYKRASSTSRVEFARFDAMRRFDQQRLTNSLKFVGNSQMKTRMEYALLVNKSITDVLPEMEGEGGECESESEKKKMEGEGEGVECESEPEKKKMEGEGEGGECESEPEKKKRKTDKKKNYDLYDDVSPYDVFQYYADEVVYKTINLEDPNDQAKVAHKRKLFEERCKLLFGMYVEEGPAAAEAKAEDAIEAAPLLV